MENHWVEDWLSAHVESNKARKEYLSIFKTFSDFCMEKGAHLENIVENYRAAMYSGFIEQQKFLDQWNDLIKSYSTYLTQTNQIENQSCQQEKGQISLSKQPDP